MFRKASEHSATMSVWSSNGKILAKVKNGRIVRVNIHTDLDEAFRRAMSGNEMSADEGEQIKTCVLCRCLVSVPVFLRCGKEGART